MIKVVSCVDAMTGGIGYKGDLLYHFKEDMKHFKEVTIESGMVVMGRKTFDSLPNGKLEGRINIVLTSNPQTISDDLFNDAEVFVFENADRLKEYVRTQSDFYGEDICIIGGSYIYNLFVDVSDELDLTIVHNAKVMPIADTYFPMINWEDWNVEVGDMKFDWDKEISYSFDRFTKTKTK